jgi:hypothetical protein
LASQRQRDKQRANQIGICEDLTKYCAPTTTRQGTLGFVVPRHGDDDFPFVAPFTNIA